MEDKFKRYIQDHREKFEKESSDFDSLWQEIDTSLKSETRRRILPLALRYVAAAIVVMLFVAIPFSLWKDDSVLPVELVEADHFYSELIEEKIVMINMLDADLETVVIHDLETLDLTYQELKRDLKDKADNAEVINAMIQTHRLKLEILEQILNELEKDKDDNIKNEIHI